MFLPLRALSILGQFFAQHVHTAMKIHANGAMRQSHARGDLRTGHPFHEAKQERLAISVRQRTQNRQNHRSLLLDNVIVAPGLRQLLCAGFRDLLRRFPAER